MAKQLSLILLAPAFAVLLSGAPQSAAVSKPGASAFLAGESTAGVGLVQGILESLTKFDSNGRNSGQKVGFELPESAINEYLAYSLRANPRPGVGRASVRFISANQLAASIEMDFNAIQEWSADAVPASLHDTLKGKHIMQVTVQFEVRNGDATFTVKEAKTPEGTVVPNAIASSLLQMIGAHQPESFDTTKPIPLPFGLKRIWIDKRLICGET